MTWESVLGIVGFLISLLTLAGVAVNLGRLLQRVDTMEKVQELHTVEIKESAKALTAIESLLARIDETLKSQKESFNDLKTAFDRHNEKG